MLGPASQASDAGSIPFTRSNRRERAHCGAQAKGAIHGLQMELASGMMLEIEADKCIAPSKGRHEGVRALQGTLRRSAGRRPFVHFT